MDTRSRQRLHLFGGRALASGDDRSGVAHAASRRRGLSGDEANHRLLDMLFHILRRSLFRCAADFADQDDRLGLRILIEQLQRVDVRGPDDGIAADADRCRLSDAALRELVDGFVGEGARARDDADMFLPCECGRA